jgi:hypothetical protein
MGRPMFLLIRSLYLLLKAYNDIIAEHLRHFFQTKILSFRKVEIDSKPESNCAKYEDEVELVADVRECCWC